MTKQRIEDGLVTGIAGYVNKTDKKMTAVLDTMAESLRQAEHVLIDRWENNSTGVCRVHHAVTSRKPQPIFNKRETHFILMDGEIFDDEKIDFGSDDAEYCLELYTRFNDQAFKELNGSFSFLICDLVNDELLLVTDRFASLPLFYTITDDGTMLFASKLSCLLQFPEVRRELDISSVFELLTFQMIFGTRTLYKNIQMVPPATALHCHGGRITPNTYWRLQYKEIKRSEQFYVETLVENFRKAVDRRTRDDRYHYGILLSGGFDSRVVLAAMSRQTSAFTFGGSVNREVRIAQAIARIKRCKHVFVKTSIDHYANILEKAIDLTDGLYSFDHAQFISLLEQTRDECDILLHGGYLDNFKGFDLPVQVPKILGRKIGFRDLKLRTSLGTDSYLAGLSEEKFVQAILDDDRFVNQILLHSPTKVFTPEYSSQLVPHLREIIGRLVCDAKERGASPSNVLDYIITWHVLSKQRCYLHLSHIRSFVPERTVMFDNELFDLYLEMPVQFKRSGKVYRKVLNKLDNKIAALPNANTGFSPRIPIYLEHILHILRGISTIFVRNRSAVTQSSFPDLAEFLRNNQDFRRTLEKTVKDPECIDPAIFNREGISQLLAEHLSGSHNHSRLLFLLLTLGKWQKKFGQVSEYHDSLQEQ